MGLSGRREKQRIPNDPRNLSWADNATKFGQAYLSKLGWDSSKGLGADGDGRKSHIKVSQKLDMLGIGGAHTKDPNGIAWKQNKEFEEILKRLNEGAEKDSSADTTDNAVEGNTCRKDEKKRKRNIADIEDGEKKPKKRRKGKDTDGSSQENHIGTTPQVVEDKTSTTTTVPVKVSAPRRMAHRARYIASKRLASKSASAISEILGITPTPTVSPLPTPPIHGTLTQQDENHTLEKLTTSTKSVADYFNERLSAKPANTRSLPSEEDTPRMGLGMGASKFASLMSGTFLASLPATAGVTQDAALAEVTDIQEQEDETKRSTLKQEKKGTEKEKRKSRKSKAAESNEHLDKPNDDEKAQRREKRAKKEKRRQKNQEATVQAM